MLSHGATPYVEIPHRSHPLTVFYVSGFLKVSCGCPIVFKRIKISLRLKIWGGIGSRLKSVKIRFCARSTNWDTHRDNAESSHEQNSVSTQKRPLSPRPHDMPTFTDKVRRRHQRPNNSPQRSEDVRDRMMFALRVRHTANTHQK